MRYFAQGARTNGLVGSSLVAFLRSLPVFFCVMASFYRVLPVACLPGVP
jgi:hypothetical protein